MKQSAASNVALALAILAWPLCYYGVLSRLGGYAPDTPKALIERQQLISSAVLFAGLLSLYVSLCLGGFGFSGAKIRSLVAIVVCLGLPLLAVLALTP